MCSTKNAAHLPLAEERQFRVEDERLREARLLHGERVVRRLAVPHAVQHLPANGTVIGCDVSCHSSARVTGCSVPTNKEEKHDQAESAVARLDGDHMQMWQVEQPNRNPVACTLRCDLGRNMGNSLTLGDAVTSGSSSVASSGVIDRECPSPLRLEVAETAPDTVQDVVSECS